MKNYILLALLLLFSGRLAAADTCRIEVDLTRVTDDRVKIRFYAPPIESSTAEYVMPAVIPGSYSRKDFGRFVKDFRACTKTGKKLKVRKNGNNVFTISKANTLCYIEYWVDDTWDAPNENYIFQPGGTNIEYPRNFVINHQGFYGYFEGYKMLPYQVTFKKIPEHYAFTPLKIERKEESDIVYASSYVKIVDNPVMFCEPDTTSFHVSNMQVHIGVYSATGKVNSSMIKTAVKPLADALGTFFGELPVDNYYFIMYFPRYATEGITSYGGFGALEHSYCSFYFLPEIPIQEQLLDIIQSVAGHEFLHILTPLNVHSEEIENFDFRNPSMSKHLWMYEGVTEYFANLVRVKTRLISETAFMEEMAGKIRSAAKFPEVSFTDMSRNILSDEYKDMYNNVYSKGALIGFLLDIRLQQLSNGTMGLRELMLTLAEKYGPSKPFKDDELIPEIVRLTYPEIQVFFDQYVKGNQPLPYKEYFDLIGWEYFHEEEAESYSFGNLNFIYSQKANQVIAVGTDESKNKYGLRTNDLLIAVNGEKVSIESDSLIELIELPRNDQAVAITYQRANEEKTVSAEPDLKKEVKLFFIRLKQEPTPQQLQLRRSVLGR